MRDVRVQFQKRLGSGWRDLADYLQVPPYQQERFESGHQARALWNWLEERGRIAELPNALDAIDRADLAGLIRDAMAEVPSRRHEPPSAPPADTGPSRRTPAPPAGDTDAVASLSARLSRPGATIDTADVTSAHIGDALLMLGEDVAGMGRLSMLLNRTEPQVLAGIIREQLPRQGAMLLVRLSDERAAQVLATLEPDCAAALLRHSGEATTWSVSVATGMSIASGPSPILRRAGLMKAANYFALMPREAAAHLLLAMPDDAHDLLAAVPRPRLVEFLTQLPSHLVESVRCMVPEGVIAEF